MGIPAPALRIALFEPDPLSVMAVRAALDSIAHQLIVFGDPALSIRDWSRCAYDIALVDPFRSCADAAAMMALMRRLAGSRPLLALVGEDCSRLRTLAIANGGDDAFHIHGTAQELATRILALVRRRRMTEGLIACDDLTIDLIDRHVCRGERAITMPQREFDLLAMLARTPDRVVPRSHLWRAVWRLDIDPGTNRLDVHMSRLRSRVDRGEAFAMLRTIKGTGYALVTRQGEHALA